VLEACGWAAGAWLAAEPQEEAGSQGGTWARGDRWWLHWQGELRLGQGSQARPGTPCEWARGLQAGQVRSTGDRGQGCGSLVKEGCSRV
jgi:hypothetical protein